MANMQKRSAEFLEIVKESLIDASRGRLPHEIYLAARKRATLQFSGVQDVLTVLDGAGKSASVDCGNLTLRIGAGHECFTVGQREFERLRGGQDEVTVHVSIAFEEIYAVPPRVLITAPQGGLVSLRDDDIGQTGFLATMTLYREWPSPSYSFEWMSVGV